MVKTVTKDMLICDILDVDINVAPILGAVRHEMHRLPLPLRWSRLRWHIMVSALIVTRSSQTSMNTLQIKDM